MSENSVPSTKKDLASKLVQEIVKRGAEIPEHYLEKDGFPEAIDAPPDLWRNELLIDFSALSSSTQELAKLRKALSKWGCFWVANHGIENSFLDEVNEVVKQFFALPLDDKLKCPAKDAVSDGYGTDEIYNGWNDRLILALYPKEKRNLENWPTKPQNFGRVMDEYSKRLAKISEVIYKAMAKSLDLDEECFLNHIGRKGLIAARFSFYPRCPYPDRILGGQHHTDTCTMTIVLPEKEIEGLQVLNDDKWYKVPVIPESLFVIFGDLGEVMTNGVFKSLEHRVVTNSEKERISVITFFLPEEDKEIKPMSELVSTHRPQLYKKTTIHESRQILHEIDKSLPLGHRILDALKL